MFTWEFPVAKKCRATDNLSPSVIWGREAQLYVRFASKGPTCNQCVGESTPKLIIDIYIIYNIIKYTAAAAAAAATTTATSATSTTSTTNTTTTTTTTTTTYFTQDKIKYFLGHPEVLEVQVRIRQAHFLYQGRIAATFSPLGKHLSYPKSLLSSFARFRVTTESV